MKLREGLESCATGLLARIAQEHGLPVPEVPARAELSAAIEHRLTRSDYLPAYLERLPPDEAEVLRHVAAEGGEVRGLELERFARRVSEAPTDDAAEPPAPIARLLRRGLLFRAFTPLGPRRGEVYCAPEECLACLRGVGQPSTALLPLEVAEPRGPLSACDPARDLFLLALALRGQRGRTDALQTIYRQLRPEASAADVQAHWRFLGRVARQAGLLQGSGKLLVPTDALGRALERRHALGARLWEAYVECSDWNELAESGVSPSPLLGRLREPREVRQRVFEVLGSLDLGCWYRLDSLVAAVHHACPDLVRDRYESAAASLLDPRTGRVLQGVESWQQVEAPLLRHVLLGPLRWLGVLNGAVDSLERPLVAVTEAGAALAAGSPVPLEPAVEPAVLERDGTLRFPERGDLAAMYRLVPYVRPRGWSEPLEFVLDVASVCDGLAEGGSLEELERSLAAVLGQPLPERARERLRAWAEEYGRVQLRPMVVLTCADEQLAARLLDGPELAPYLSARLGPRAARVASSHLPLVARKLRELGVYPKIDAALKLMAGRGAYAALVDERAIELLFTALEALRQLAPSALAELVEAEELPDRLRAALGTERARTLRARARRLVSSVAKAERAAAKRE